MGYDVEYDANRKLLYECVGQLDIELSDLMIDSFIIYLQTLKKWNRAYNLTALNSDRDIIIKHFVDSLLYLTAIPDSVKYICDIGSGAGFPGIPIAMARPELHVALIEPSRKKASFLRHIKRTLLLKNIEVLESRVEDVKERLFDIVVTRALFSVKELIQRASHVLRHGGFFILSKGQRYESEIKEMGNLKQEVITASLPCSSIKRHLIIVSGDVKLSQKNIDRALNDHF
ncbi:MAG: 16S rRNA (guanine(527)-N(7))-methyltransferase RsmG [Nitrospirae bacterium]|nr:16S rRNA (guanine(527)-N(7))-methyltransferase RsmG [Nitrospirota bacterium]